MFVVILNRCVPNYPKRPPKRARRVGRGFYLVRKAPEPMYGLLVFRHGTEYVAAILEYKRSPRALRRAVPCTDGALGIRGLTIIPSPTKKEAIIIGRPEAFRELVRVARPAKVSAYFVVPADPVTEAFLRSVGLG